jgi:hypothetical protein
LETSLGPLGGIHLVDGDDELLDTESVGEKSVFTSLAILGDTSLELTTEKCKLQEKLWKDGITYVPAAMMRMAQSA